MVKPLYSLALRALQTNREVMSHLTRIQHGFMPERNIQELEHVIQDLQQTLNEMRKSLQNPSGSPPIVPLK